MKYQQFTYEERLTLSALRLQDISIRAIAKTMDRHFSTVYRELERNRCYKMDGAYRHSNGHTILQNAKQVKAPKIENGRPVHVVSLSAKKPVAFFLFFNTQRKPIGHSTA